MRRIDLRRSEGVAMTEFALILPVFILIVAGLLGFGRVFFYWIEANHVANETARWAIVDPNPYPATYTDPTAALQKHAARPCAHGGIHRRQRLHLHPGRRHPDARSAARGDGPQALHVPPGPGHRDHHDSRAASTMRIENFKNGTSPTPSTALALRRRAVHMNRMRGRARRRPRSGGCDDPGVSAARGARCRCRQLVHAQAPAPEPRRCGCVRCRRRVRKELEGLCANWRRNAQAHHGPRDRRRGTPVRGGPRDHRLFGSAGDALQHRNHRQIPNQTKTATSSINSSDPDYNDDTDHSDLGGNTASPCLVHAGDGISAAAVIGPT